jgi:acyl-CoA thioesterase II
MLEGYYMNALTQELVELLTLEKLEEHIFRGNSRNLVGKRVFGGQVLGQALRAASYTTNRPAHSLHAYFLYGGDVDAPIIYEVDPLRDGKSFASRQVRAIQHGRTIFSAMVSFANPEEGLNYQHKEPEYPSPEELKSEKELKKVCSISFQKMHVRVLCANVMWKSDQLDQLILFSRSLKHHIMRTTFVPMIVLQKMLMTFHYIKPSLRFIQILL